MGEYLSRYYFATGRPAENQTQILHSVLLFAMLFNRTDTKLGLTAWVEEIRKHEMYLFQISNIW